MKFLIVFALLAAVGSANPIEPQHVAVTQDTAGNYKLAFNADGYTRAEQGHADGTVSGSYSYIDANGVVRNVQYTAGPDGFRATGDNLPVAPVDINNPVGDTEEVVRARAMHFALLKQGLPLGSV